MADVPPSNSLEDYETVICRRTPGSDLWYGYLTGYPEVNAFHRSWGGLRFALARSLDEYIELVELANKKAEAK